MKYLVNIQAKDDETARDCLSNALLEYKQLGLIDAFEIEELYWCVHSDYCDKACSGGD